MKGGLIGIIKKRFGQEQDRGQINFACDRKLSLALKMLARSLGVPRYTFAEHALQLGIREMVVLMQAEKTKQELKDHLVYDHLLVLSVDPEKEPAPRPGLGL